MKVKIKTWDKMVEDFGTDSFGGVCCSGRFPFALEKEIPKDRIINVIDNRWDGWLISQDMIECVIDEPSGETGIKHDNGKPFYKEVSTSFEAKVRNICVEICDMLLEKNKSYGNSVQDPICVFSNATPQERIAVRLDDKLSRIMKGHEYGNEDTELDIIGYLILKRIIKNEKA